MFSPFRFLCRGVLQQFVELAVIAAARHEFVMRALINQFAVTDNENAVGVADGGKPVGDDDAGAVFHQLAERVLDEHFGGVSRRAILENKTTV